MIKKSWIIGAGLIAVLGGAGAAYAASGTSGDYIGKAKAKQIALEAVPGTVTDIDLERHGSTVYYEIDIDRKDSFQEADVYIDARTGKVLRVVEDDNDDDHRGAATSSAVAGEAAVATAQPSASASTSAPPSTPAATAAPVQSGSGSFSTASSSSGAAATSITSERAVEIAKQAVKGELIRVKTERDDGRLEYEVKLKTDSGTVDVEIAASTGKVLDIDYDNDLDDDRDDWEDDDGDYDDWDDNDD